MKLSLWLINRLCTHVSLTSWLFVHYLFIVWWVIVWYVKDPTWEPNWEHGRSTVRGQLLLTWSSFFPVFGPVMLDIVSCQNKSGISSRWEPHAIEGGVGYMRVTRAPLHPRGRLTVELRPLSKRECRKSVCSSSVAYRNCRGRQTENRRKSFISSFLWRMQQCDNTDTILVVSRIHLNVEKIGSVKL